MKNNNYPPGVFNLPGDNIRLIEHNYEVDGGFTVEIYENEDKKEFIEENIRSILYEAYKKGTITIQEYWKVV